MTDPLEDEIIELLGDIDDLAARSKDLSSEMYLILNGSDATIAFMDKHEFGEEEEERHD